MHVNKIVALRKRSPAEVEETGREKRGVLGDIPKLSATVALQSDPSDNNIAVSLMRQLAIVFAQTD